MKFSLYTVYARDKRSLTRLHEIGVRLASIVDTELSEISLSDYSAMLREVGIEPDTVVSTADIISTDLKKRKKALSDIGALTKKMRELGIPTLMIAPSPTPACEREEMLDIMLESYRDAVKIAEGCGVRCAIENQSSALRTDSRTEDIRLLLDSIPSLGFILDSGNFLCIGEDVMRAYEQLSDRLVGIHAKDWVLKEQAGGKRLCGVALGDGIIPLRELFARIKANSRDVPAVLEINSPNITFDTVERSARFMKKYI